MIPTQLPAPVTMKPTELQALALQPGQVLEAVVTGQNAAGATLVMAGKQQMALALQQAMAPGTTLQMRVETTPSGTRLAIVAQTPPDLEGGGEAIPAQALAATQKASPPVSEQAVTRTTQAPISTGQRIPQTPINPPAPAETLLPQSATVIERHDAPVPRLPATAEPMQPGQVVDARVVGQTSTGQTEVSIGKQRVQLELPTTPQPGTVVQVRLEETPVGQRLVVVPPPASPGGPPVPVPPAVAAAVAPGTAAKTDPVPKTTVAITAPAPVTAATPVAQHGPSPSMPNRPMPALPQTEQAAVTQMVQVAASRQDTAAPLMAALVALSRGRAALPAPVAQAAGQVLATRTNLDAPLDGETLQKAVLASGVFQEAQLASGQASTAAPRGDLKAALLALRGALVTWLGEDAGETDAPALVQQPPVRGSVPRALKEHIDPGPTRGTPEDIGKTLLDRTDNALARVRLHQHASLPDQTARATAEWHLELPVIINQQQSVMQFQITRDGGGVESSVEAERSWHVRFAVNLSKSGEIGAQVGLRGQRASVLLWAETDSTAQNLRTLMPQLSRELVAAGLEVGPISVRSGPPTVAHGTPPAGNLVDALR